MEKRNVSAHFRIPMKELLFSLIIFASSPATFGQQEVGDEPTKLAPGKAPPLPKAGILAQPRPRSQVGFPEQLTQAVIPKDNPITPAKVDLGLKLFFDS